MTKTAIVYWSGTGNTAAMAHFVADGAKSAGADVSVFTADEFSADKINAFDSVAFGCPARTAGATASGCALGRTIANL